MTIYDGSVAGFKAVLARSAVHVPYMHATDMPHSFVLLHTTREELWRSDGSW